MKYTSIRNIAYIGTLYTVQHNRYAGTLYSITDMQKKQDKRVVQPTK